MDSQKFENLLNLSLDATEEEREKSAILNTGYDENTKTWELIVKYHGDIQRLASEAIQIEPLIAGYAIVTIQENLVEAFAALEEIEYVEIPKRLFFAVESGKQESCILQVTDRAPNLTGKGVLVGIIDSGIDYYNEHFRNPAGSTRIRNLWDQSLAPNAEQNQMSPAGYTIGVEFTQNQINAALQTGSRSEAYAIVPSRDISGHGTAVAGIATANSAYGTDVSSNATPQANRSQGAAQFYEGVAMESELIVVKLGNQSELGFPRTTELMRALKYVVDKALEYNQPIAINLSFGNTYGSHTGMSLLERYIDNIAEIGRTVVCIGSGNEGSASGHSAGTVQQNAVSRIELAVAQYETGLSVQLWKNYVDDFVVSLVAPNGERQQLPSARMGMVRLDMDGTEILAYIGEPRPYSVNQEIFIDMLPQERYIASGVWIILLEPVRIVSGEYNLYLPSQTIRNAGTRFYQPTPEVTLTIPSTSQAAITVGAYDARQRSYADFSGRGYVTKLGQENAVIVSKPELVAPGVGIEVLNTTGGLNVVSGTSYATPFVTGSAALLMEWGIVRGNDPYLYGEKVKAYLIKGASTLPGFAERPNPAVGWGALCVRGSLPV